jgi:hypothetical protein
MTIGDICEFKTNFLEADFWLIRKGSENTVGTPVKAFSAEHIGVKVIQGDPKFMYYFFVMLHNQGIFKQLATGTLRLQHIRIADVKSIPIRFK